jgi:uncharacterized protein
MNDLVSVIIPTYNRSHFVTQAIDSVLCQTYPNIELIVVNDGSTDDTEEKLQPYMDSITYISKENGGISSAVNAGLRIANGEYIARLDDDDLFMPEKTEKQLRVFAENPEVGLVTCEYFVADEVGRPTSLRKMPDFSRYGPFLSILLRELMMFPSIVTIRREAYDQVGLYRDVFAEDLDMHLRVTRYWDVGVVNQPLVKYRWHFGNITSTTPEDKKSADVNRFTRDILEDTSLAELFPGVDFMSDPYRESCAYTAKGALYIRYSIFDSAETNLLNALELCPDNPVTLLWLGISARTQGDFQSAEEYFGRIQEKDELYAIAQNAKDLITAIRRNIDKESPLLWKARLNEYRKLFGITYNGISGKGVEKAHKSVRIHSGLRLSQYTVTIENYPDNGKHLLFNTLTHAMVSIDDQLKGLIHESDPPAGEDALKDIRMLKRMGMLVDQQVNEAELSRKFHNTLRTDLSKIYVKILTTYDCNFACGYCIEEGVKRPIYMDAQCSDALVTWLMDRAENNSTEQISLFFYGGEPLLNPEPVYRISETLQRFAVEKGVVVSSSITTNGSLIDSEMLRDLTKLGLMSIKTTIDGEREIHNARRPFKSGRGSFDIIMENISKIPETVKLIIQTNVDSENIENFPRLLDLFESLGLKERIDNLVVSPIYQPFDSVSMLAAHDQGCMKLSDPRLDDALNYAERLIAARGFKSSIGNIKYRVCGMNSRGVMLVIDPLGVIYSCPAFVGRESYSIGDIYHSELDGSKELPEEKLEECFHCGYFPVCGGGCRYNAYTLYGDHTRISCEKDAMDSHMRELIRLQYDQKMESKEITGDI